ncbi:MAG: site-specific integrase [Pirellulales bacterium]
MASGELLTIDLLCIDYLEYAKHYYRSPSGTVTSEYGSLRSAFRPLVEEFGTTLASDFGPLALKRVRERMIEKGHCRTSINDMVHRIRRMFAWAVENELVDVTVHEALRRVACLRVGRTEARESERILPVSVATVNATLPHLPQVVADMVRLQLATGARPGEICQLRPQDVDRSTEPWLYRPAHHKTAHRGKERRIYIGPEGQAILSPYLDRKPHEFCFSPAESIQAKRDAAHLRRRLPLTHGNRPGTNRKVAPRWKPTREYDRTAYTRAIARGCEKAFGMPRELRVIPGKLPESQKAELRKKAAEWRAAHVWSPNQLRHTRATMLREKFGIEAAQTVLGHSELSVTEMYAERNFAKAAEIMREVG